MDHQDSTTNDTPDLTQNSRPQQLGASPDLVNLPHPGHEKWAASLCQGALRGPLVTQGARDDLGPLRLNNFDILATASRRAFLEDGWAFTDCDWRAFLSQTILGQIKAKEELMVMLAQDLNDFRSNDAPMRTRPAGQEELHDSQSFEKQWADANIENPSHPGPMMTWPPEKLNASQSFEEKEAASNQEELVDSQSNEKTWALQAHEEVQPPEQWTTSPNQTSVSASEDKYARTSTLIDQVLWYLEGLYQGEPPPKNRRLLRPNCKRTRIKEDLQGQASLHGRECWSSCVRREVS
jgi:hypothetical protein